MNANLKAVCSLHTFYPTACVSTHAVVLCDMNGRQMPLTRADQQLRAARADQEGLRFTQIHRAVRDAVVIAAHKR